jgi:hypothetical protein
MSRAKKRLSPRTTIHPRIPPDLAVRLKGYRALTGASESAVVEAALRKHLELDSDAERILRRFDRLNRRVDRLQREVEVNAEFLAVWSQMWFAYTPQLPTGAREQARHFAARRYEEMTAHVIKRLNGPKRLLTDILGQYTDDESPKPEKVTNGSV